MHTLQITTGVNNRQRTRKIYILTNENPSIGEFPPLSVKYTSHCQISIPLTVLKTRIIRRKLSSFFTFPSISLGYLRI